MLKTYKISFNKGFKVSLVKDPAIESTLLAFSNEVEKPLYFTIEEKQIIYSVAMIPNKLIFRQNINGEPAQVFYDEQAIEDFQMQYFRNGNLGTNVNHAEENTIGIFPFESWIVGDDNRAELLGLDAPKGSLVMGFKIDNADVWNEVKNGNLDGLSVEGFPKIEEVTNKQINMNTEKTPQGFWELCKAFFAVEPAKTEEEIAKEATAEGEPVAEETTEPTPDTDLSDVNMKLDTLTKLVEDLQKQLLDSEAKKVEAETALQKMKAETPASAPISVAPVEVKMTKEQEALYKFKRQHGIN